MFKMAKIYFDAATKGNPGMSTYGVVIVDEQQRFQYSDVIGEKENHEAEWEALLVALNQAARLNITNALIYTDSKLIEDAVQRKFVKNIKYKNYLNQYLKISQQFELCFVKWVPREQNKEANMLAQTKLHQYSKQNKIQKNKRFT